MLCCWFWREHYEYWFAAVALHKLDCCDDSCDSYADSPGDFIIPHKSTKGKSDCVYRAEWGSWKSLQHWKEAGTTAKLWCVQNDVDGFENLTITAMRRGSFWKSRVMIRTLATRSDDAVPHPGISVIQKGVIHELAILFYRHGKVLASGRGQWSSLLTRRNRIGQHPEERFSRTIALLVIAVMVYDFH